MHILTSPENRVMWRNEKILKTFFTLLNCTYTHLANNPSFDELMRRATTKNAERSIKILLRTHQIQIIERVQKNKFIFLGR